MKRILITGFDPFGGEKINPAWEAVQRLPGRIGAAELTVMQVPTVFAEAAQTVLAHAEMQPPDAIVCVGQAGGRAAVTPEMVAINLQYASIADNAGKMPKDVPVVSGTTGWLDKIGQVKEMCEKEGKTFFYASNFSIGVNIFFALNKYLAKIMNNFPAYDIKMMETHHIHKLDAPSGTAITLAEGILENVDRKDRWTLETAEKATDIPIHAIREGEVPGIHEITYESDVDTISIKHDAKSRAGFALGAVIAAGKKGFLGMDDMLKF